MQEVLHPRLERWLRPDRVVLLVLVLLLLVYGPSLQNRFTEFDDTGFITDNHLVTDRWPKSLVDAFTSTSGYLYMPLTLVSWQMNYRIFGADPFWFHLIDLCIHAFNTLLVFWILDRLLGRKFAAFLATLLFAVHPLNVEAVAWAASRKDILSALFALLSTCCYLNAVDSNDSRWRRKSLIFYVLGLFTKISVLPLPLLFVNRPRT